MTFARSLTIASAVLFFALAVWFGRPAGLWNSPDETANAFWAGRVAQGASLRVQDAIVGLGAGAIHPRSMAVVGDTLVPGSFPGLILLYGALRFLLKLPFFLLTPLFTLAAGACFAAAVGRLFDRRVGLAAAALFFLHPAVLYYGARGLFHNVLFVDLLILSASCFVLRKDRIGDILGGFLFGWAICTRTSEAIWAVPAFLIFLPFIGKERWRRLGWAITGMAIPVCLLLSINTSLYGSSFKTPYVAAAPVVIAESNSPSVESVQAAGKPASGLRLPFGFDAKRSVRNAWSYGLALFWWQSGLAVLGLVWWFFSVRRASATQKTFAVAALLTAAWLAALYGSWAIRDRFDPEEVTIGTSYVRYFLPAYVAMLPFGAFALVRLSEKVKMAFMPAALLAACAVLTVHSAVFAGDESLRAVRATLGQNAVKREVLLGLFPPDAVVMTERFDKLIVPERLRIIPATDDSAFAAAANIARQAPVYWYGLTPSEDEHFRLMLLAKAHGLSMLELSNPIAGEAVYLLEFRQLLKNGEVQKDALEDTMGL